MIAVDKKGVDNEVEPKVEESNSGKNQKRRAAEKAEKMMTREKADRLKRAGITR